MSKAAANVYQTALEEQERQDIVVSNLPFVRHVLGRLVGRIPNHVDVENLEAAGVLGLVEASHQFDASRGVTFQSFAYPRVWGAIVDEMRRNSPFPQKLMNRISTVKRIQETMSPPITVERISDCCDLTVGEVESCLVAIGLSSPTPLGDHAAQVANYRNSESVSASMEEDEQKVALADAIERLPEQQRLVITMYYSEDLRLKEIGRVLNLSESRISRILAAAELRLRELVSP